MPDDKRQDPIFLHSGGKKIGRDGCRVPMPWDDSSPTFGFSAGAKSWLPIPDWFRDFTAEREDGDERSTLHLYRQALRIRREVQDVTEKMSWVGLASESVLHVRRPGGWEIMTNMGSRDDVEIPDGEVLIASGSLASGRLSENTTVWISRK